MSDRAWSDALGADRVAIVNGNATINLSVSDIEIGAVEIKNATDDTRAVVGANGLYVDVRSVAAGVNNIGFATVTVASGGGLATVNINGSQVNYVDDADWTDSTSQHTLIGGIYQSTPQTITDGDTGPLEVDANGNLKTTLATALAGEDLTAGVIKVEERFTGVNVTADAQIKAAAGFLHTVTIMPTDVAATAGTIIIYDNTAESGTVLGTVYIPAAYHVPVTLTFDCNFATGLYVGFNTTNDVNVTVSYR